MNGFLPEEWLIEGGWLSFCLVFAFAVGAAVGSFLNVCVARLPYEKSLLWPGSRCGSCFQAIASRDNVPLLGYLRLRGRCRQCGARFSAEYFLVELLTGLSFAGLLYLLLFVNARNLPTAPEAFRRMHPDFLRPLPLYFHHVLLLSFLLAASLCDLRHMEIPLSITSTGTIVGLIFAVCCPWPFPESLPRLGPVPRLPLAWAPLEVPGVSGVYAWPVWYPLPAWLPPGSWQLGLATGVAGMLAGMFLLRMVRFLFGVGRGIEGLGMGDADLMMMAGAFVGWQPVVLAFFLSVFPALLLALVQLVRRGDQALPFGPPLALGVLLTLLTWPTVAPRVSGLFFDPLFLLVVGGTGSFLLLVTAFLLRLVHGIGPESS